MAERTIADMETLLNGKLEAPVKKKQGFDYVSWNDSVRQLNRIFGSLGWSDEVVSLTRTEYGYTCVLKLTFFLPNGTTRTHTGVGYGIVRKWFTDKITKEEKPLSSEMQAQAEDQGVKSAASDALSRACKRWAALGIALYGGEDLPYDEDETPAPPSRAPTQRQNTGQTAASNPPTTPRPAQSQTGTNTVTNNATQATPAEDEQKRIGNAIKAEGVKLGIPAKWLVNYATQHHMPAATLLSKLQDTEPAVLLCLQSYHAILLKDIQDYMAHAADHVLTWQEMKDALCDEPQRTDMLDVLKEDSRPSTQPTSGTTPRTPGSPATDRQITSIKKLCTALHRAEPDTSKMTFTVARELLTQLSHAYSEARHVADGGAA